MSDYVSCALSAVLCGVTGYGFSMIAPQEHPYAFTACVIGFCHGLLGVINTFAENDNLTTAKKISSSILDIVPVPLVNVDLFLNGEGNNIGLGHGLFIVPLAVSVLIALFKGEGEESEALETLKVMTVLGNITSLVYLAFNDGSWVEGGMAFLAFMSKYGTEFIEGLTEQPLEALKHLCWCGYYFLTTMAINGEK